MGVKQFGLSADNPAMSLMADARFLSRPQILAVRIWGVVTTASFVIYGMHLATGLGGHRFDNLANHWLYDSLELLAAMGCFARAAWVPSERAVWAVLGFAVVSFSVGDIVFDVVYSGNPPTPSAADPFYLAFY